MENDFIEFGKKKYTNVELVEAMGPMLISRYWQSTEHMTGHSLRKGMTLYNSKQEPLGTIKKFNKKGNMIMVRLLKPLLLDVLYMAGVELKHIVFEKD